MERMNIELRQSFTPQERRKIYLKSDNRCCHCGCTIDSDGTIEHVIPLDKGGTNDFSNLVALCKDCNSSKDNLICHPLEFYPYLKSKYLDELVTNQNKYYKEFRWLTKTNFIPEDIKVLSVPFQLASGKMDRKSHIGIKFKVRKGLEEDFDRVVEYINKYNKKYYGSMTCEDAVLSMDELIERVRGYYDNGCIYIIESLNREIKCVIPMKITHSPSDISESYARCKERDPSQLYKGTMFYIENIITLYNKTTTGNMVLVALRYIFSSLANLHFTKDNILVVGFNTNTNTSLGQELPMFIGSDAIDMRTSVAVNDNDEKVGNLYMVTLAFEDGEYNFYKNDSIVKRLRDSGGNVEALQKEFTASVKERLGYRNRVSVSVQKATQEETYSNRDAYHKVITCMVEDLYPSKSSDTLGVVPSFRYKQFKSGTLPPIKIRQNMKIHDGYDIYKLLKERGIKEWRCEVTGKLTISPEILDIHSDFNKKREEYMLEVEVECDDSDLIKEAKKQDCRCRICRNAFKYTDDAKLMPVRAFINDNVVICHDICTNLLSGKELNASVRGSILKELSDAQMFSIS